MVSVYPFLSNDDQNPPDLEQVEEKLRRLYSEMIRVAYSKVINKSDAQDAVQEAWVRILTKHETLKERSKLNSWAKTITANVALNLNKQTMREQGSSRFDSNGEFAEHACHVEAGVQFEISELLGLLDPRSRTMLLYKFYYGFKDQEIADAMKVPLGTVKARIHRSKLQLKKLDGHSDARPM
jgi:RNA polymerase sigma-70 factor (ECF subfamily)